MKNSILEYLGGAVCFIFSISLAMADTHYVDVNSRKSSQPYESWKTAATELQAAIEVAKSGDTILLADGVYEVDSPVKVNKSLTIRSRNGRDCTTVMANGHSRVFVLHAFAGPVELQGLTISGGYMAAKGGVGGGVVADGNGPIKISGCRIENNEAIKHGGGIHFCLKPGTVIEATISESIIQNNRAGGHGGGIHATMWDDVSGVIRVEDCIINNNRAGKEGGGVRCSSTKGLVVLDRCLISNNAAGQGGGVLLGRNTIIANSLIYRNEALSADGGGIRSGGSGNSGHEGDEGGDDHDCGGAHGGTDGHDDGDGEHDGGDGHDGDDGGSEGHDDGDGGHDGDTGSDGHDGDDGHDGGKGGSDGGKGKGGAGAGGLVINCTITENSAATSSGGVKNPYIYNSIVYGNSALTDQDIGSGSAVSNTCSSDLVEGLNGNINARPLFINATAGDFRLLATSPCIDTGSNEWVVQPFDLGWHNRIADGDLDDTAVVDIGAYEFQGILLKIDMLPGSDKNPMNLKSRGRLPVAILTDSMVNALDIVPASVRFCDAAPLHSAHEDIDGNGSVDLILYFDRQQLNVTAEGKMVYLFGQTFDGRLVMGEAVISGITK